MVFAALAIALMALFCLAFYATKIPLPITACWLVVIGGIANPCVFVVAAFDPDFWEKTIWKVYSAISFIITTIGFAWVGITLLTYAL